MNQYLKVILSVMRRIPWARLSVALSVLSPLKRLFSKKEASMVDQKLVDQVEMDVRALMHLEHGLLRNLSDLYAIIHESVADIQKLTKDVLVTGKQKKDVAVAVINRIVDIPYLPEKVEEFILNYGIDLAIAQLKRLAAKRGVNPSDWVKLIE